MDGSLIAIPQPTTASVTLMHYSDWVSVLSWVLLVGFPVILLCTGWAARIRDACGRISGRRSGWTVTLYAVAYLSMFTVLFFPVHLVIQLLLTHYGLTYQGIGPWFGDQVIHFLIEVVVVCLVSWIPYWILRKSPKRWWIWCLVPTVPLVTFLFIVQPIWVDPLFHDYQPLQNEKLSADITVLAARAGVTNIPVLQYHSDGSDGCSACVVGLGPSRRIELSDDLLAKYSEPEILWTVGHELKHYVMDDNIKGVVIICGMIFLGLWATHRLGGAAIVRWSGRFGFDDLADPASLPLLVLCLTLVYLTLQPAFLAYARHVEFEADRFSLELTHDNQAMGTVMLKGAHDGLVPNPDWFWVTFHDNHPSIAKRIEFANTYRPWEQGKRLVYAAYFK